MFVLGVNLGVPFEPLIPTKNIPTYLVIPFIPNITIWKEFDRQLFFYILWAHALFQNYAQVQASWQHFQWSALSFGGFIKGVSLCPAKYNVGIDIIIPTACSNLITDLLMIVQILYHGNVHLKNNILILCGYFYLYLFLHFESRRVIDEADLVS